MLPSEMKGDIIFMYNHADSIINSSSSDRAVRDEQVANLVKTIEFRSSNGSVNRTFTEGKGITYSWRIARDCFTLWV